MNSRQLEYFVTLCRTGNVTSASEELFLTRQALSKSLRALEEEVGSRLFVRKSNGVELTEAGHTVRDSAQQILLMWNHALDRVSMREVERIIRLGVHMTHITDEAIDFCMAYQDKASNVRIELYDNEDYTSLFKLLRENRLDIANVRKRPENEDLKWFKTRDCIVYLMVHKDNPLAELDSVDFMRDLKGCRSYVVSRDTIAEMTPYANEAGIVLEYMTPSLLALRVALNHNRGVFFSPDISAKMLASETIVARRVDAFPLETVNYFVYRPNPSALIVEYLDYLQGFSSLPVHCLNGQPACRRP
ncbi:MAG: LysR family transcriptional regulator [Coriobacteriales bacterium]|jgi:DNA-binding transcriptional LysR family regulator|nr:LysR family transcriptional regulator [Coriobacteriales bacterium]